MDRQTPDLGVGCLTLPEFQEVIMDHAQGIHEPGQNPPGQNPPETPQEFARRLGLPFSDILLLNRALTHRSYLNEHPDALEDNERLEFLGDAVLDFLVGAWLYNHFPEMSEGDLTRMRSALVRTDTLADFGRKIGLDAVMRLGRGEDEGGGRTRPAILCGTFEAMVGALYIESGFSAVSDFIEPLLEEAAAETLSAHNEYDSKSLFQEWAQSQNLGTPQYRTCASFGPDHDKTFEVEVLVDGVVYGKGEGKSKQAAAKEAAREAMQILGLE
jgi:ribonuclease-3